VSGKPIRLLPIERARWTATRADSLGQIQKPLSTGDAFAYRHDPARMRVKDVMTQRDQVLGWRLMNREQRLVEMVTSAD
jgi:hypothetical protein